MGSLLFTDYEALNRDAKHLHERLAACIPAMKKACTANETLFLQALDELTDGEFKKRGGKLRMVAEEAGVLSQVAELLPLLKNIQLERRKPYMRELNLETFAEDEQTAKTFLLESRLRAALENTLVYKHEGEKRVPLSFEEAVRDEHKRRAWFLEACNDLMRKDAPGTEFDAKKLHAGAALAHHRVLTNQPVIIPYFSVQRDIESMQSPWYLDQLHAKMSGYEIGFGFAKKQLNSEHKTSEQDRQLRDYWVPAISIDPKIYEPLMKLRKSPPMKMVVDDTLGAIQKFFMVAGHDYLHHTMYTHFTPKRTMQEGGAKWNAFDGPDSLFRHDMKSPEPLTGHLEQYQAINPSQSSHNEYYSMVMHHRILRHLFNAETIDGKPNTRGKNIKEALIKSGEAFAENLGTLRTALGKERVSKGDAQNMTECLAMLGLSQLALAIDLDDKDMKRVYAAFEKHQIFGEYKLPAKQLATKLSYFSGHYLTPPAGGMTRGYLESAEPAPNHRYRVEAIKKWTAHLQPDEPVSKAVLTGEDGIRARILTKPLGEVVGWLNEPGLGEDFCPRIAQTYYDAFTSPQIIDHQSYRTAAGHFASTTGIDAGFSRT